MSSALITWYSHSPPCGCIRVWDAGEYGDPYQWCCTVVHRSHEVVELVGTLTAPTTAQRHAMARALLDAGYTRVRIERRHGGNVRVVEKTIRDPG